jgi:hypothetical protein
MNARAGKNQEFFILNQLENAEQRRIYKIIRKQAQLRRIIPAVGQYGFPSKMICERISSLALSEPRSTAMCRLNQKAYLQQYKEKTGRPLLISSP